MMTCALLGPILQSFNNKKIGVTKKRSVCQRLSELLLPTLSPPFNEPFVNSFVHVTGSGTLP